MATFIEATETSDEGKRKELMDKIVAYNKEDLGATWACSSGCKPRLANLLFLCKHRKGSYLAR